MRARTYLMCPPEHFTAEYAINPWMKTAGPVVYTGRALLVGHGSAPTRTSGVILTWPAGCRW